MARDKSKNQAAPDVRFVVEALNAGQTQVALDACLALLARSPGEPALAQLAATAALRLGRHKDAKDLARRSLAARPDHVPTLLILGRAARASKAHDEAVDALTRAVACAANSADAAFELRSAEIDAGQPPDHRRLQELKTRFPHEHAGWETLAQSCLATGHRECALDCLSTAARAAPTFALAMRRALLCRDLDYGNRAREALEEAVRLQPDAARAWFLLGVSAQDSADREACEEAYRRALILDPALVEAAVNLGTLLQERGDLEGAKAFYAQAVKTRPDTFGRVAQAMTTSPRGELWLDLQGLRRTLAG